MKPALTAEEWEHTQAMTARYPDLPEWAADEIGLVYGLHGVAAWALRGQPFGFTREECEGQHYDDAHAYFYALGRLADRIEALLPPA